MARVARNKVNNSATTDMKTVRRNSVTKLAALGLSANEQLPLSDWPAGTRTVDEIVRRCESLCLCVAKANQVSMDYVGWAREKGMLEKLHERELLFLTQANSMHEETTFFRAQEEALWTLCWSVGLVNEIQVNKPCDQTLAGVSPGPFRASPVAEDSLALQPIAEIVQLDDCLYLMDNLIVGLHLRGENAKRVPPHYVVRFRRYATRWLLSDEDYYESSIDT